MSEITMTTDVVVFWGLMILLSALAAVYLILKMQARIVELTEEQKKYQWLPISTAPKDGREIMLGRFYRNPLWKENESDVFFQWVGYWIDRTHDKSGSPSAWTALHGLQPDYWAPLRPPPERSKRDG